MKVLFKLIPIIVFSFLISCEVNEEEVLLENNSDSVTLDLTKQIVVAKQNDCTLSVNNANPITFVGETRVFSVSVSSSISANPSYRWSILNGANTQILGSSNGSTFRVRFNSGFSSATIRVIVNNGRCDLRMDISAQGGSLCTNPPAPHPIDSQFGTPVPPGYIESNLGQNFICSNPNTINNRLFVPFDPCVNYSWSITPSGNDTAAIFPTGHEAIVSIKKTGRYKVLLTTSNNLGQRFEQFILIAEDCDQPGGGGIF